VPASQYKTKEGFINEQSLLGMAITQDSAAQLNRIIVSEFLKQDVPAVSLYVSNSVVLDQGKVLSYYDEVFREYLKHNLLPVTTGDVVVDATKGCGIWSADTILPFFAQKFQENGWKVQQLLHVTVTPGVYKDVTKPEEGIFEEISSKNIEEVQAAMGEVKGFDVTGGMWTKIQECMALAKDQGIESRIISGEEPGAIEKVLLENASLGTLIRA
jgi:isopentenyl phosphate kinase